MTFKHLTDAELVRLTDSIGCHDDLPMELASRLHKRLEIRQLYAPIEVHLDKAGMAPEEAASLLTLLAENGITNVTALELRLAVV